MLLTTEVLCPMVIYVVFRSHWHIDFLMCDGQYRQPLTCGFLHGLSVVY